VLEDPKSYLAGKEYGENGEEFTHAEWFRRKGLPYSGKEYDRIPRGVAVTNAPKPGQMTLTRSDLAEYLGDYNKNIPQEVYDHFKAKYPNHIFASIAAGGPGSGRKPEGQQRTHDVCINKAYFPKALHPKGIAEEAFERWKVKAGSRSEAAAKVWAQHGDRLLQLMAPHKDGQSRHVSLHVSSPKAGVGGFAGRLDPIRVNPYKTAIRAGGPGSGCHGPNCGKPKGTVTLKNSLRIPRSKMPQISKANLKDYIAWLGKQGIATKEETINPESLKPIQKTVNKDVALMLPPDVNIPDRPMVVSKDSYILDGHHRWYRALTDHLPLNAVRIDSNMTDLLEKTKQYPNVEYRTPQETAKKWFPEKKLAASLSDWDVDQAEILLHRSKKMTAAAKAILFWEEEFRKLDAKLSAEGTSEGAVKGWDTRGRSERRTEPATKKWHGDLPSYPPPKEEDKPVAKPAAAPGTFPPVDKYSEQPPLTPAQLEVQDRFAKYIEKDPQAAIDEYVNGKEDRKGFGNVVNADNAKELSVDYRADRSTNACAVHEPSSWLAKQVYKQILASPVPEDKYNTAFFMTGGPGTGKTTAIEGNKTLSSFIKNSNVVMDGTFAGFKSADAKIQQALAAGRDAIIAYVHRDPDDAFENGILRRAEHGTEGQQSGRTVPIDWAAPSYVNVRKSVDTLADKYKGDKRVHFIGIDNTHGKGQQKFMKYADLPPMTKSIDDLKKSFSAILEKKYAEGAISQKVYLATKAQG
jgi:hypothetical protein